MNSIDHPEGRLHAQDLMDGKPGRSHTSVGAVRYPMVPSSDPREVEAHNFAKHLVDHLYASQDHIEKLYISASPAFLGQIRPLLNKQLSSLLAGEVAKDLTTMNANEIREHFPFVL